MTKVNYSARTFIRRRRKYFKTILGLMFMAIFLFPLYWMLNVSLQPRGVAINSPIFPIHPDFSGYKIAFLGQGIHLRNSLINSSFAVLVILLISTPAAFAISKLKIRGANVYLLLILVSQMIPGIVIANSLYSLYVKIHLLNTFPGIILAVSTVGVPFSILLMTGFMRNISRDIMEAAEMDGATPFRMYRSIIVPMSRNVIITSAVFTFLFAWGDFVYSVTLISKQSMTPVTVSLYTYIGTDNRSWGPILATAVLSSLPAIVLLISSQKYIRAGVTAGSVK